MEIHAKMSTEDAAGILGVELPTEFRLVKAAYRCLALFCHPDVGGDPDKFMEVESAYRILEDNPELFMNSDEIIKMTVDDIPLSELGKGHPLNISAKTCESCVGRGYSILKEPRWVKCNYCRATGWKHVPCKRCGGKGKLNNKTECPWCKGSKEFVPYEWAKKNGKLPKANWNYGDPMWGFYNRIPRHYYCEKCNGDGKTLEPEGKAYAVKCDECKGVGEVKMFNPALPRGLLRSR